MSNARRYGLLISSFAILIVGMVLTVAVRRATQTSLAMSCANNLKQVALGIENYHATYGQLPRHAMLDDGGIRIHSWRAAVTPFLAAIDQLYRWDEPWDGPFNMRLAHGLSIHVDGPPPGEVWKTIGPYDGPIDYAWPFRCPSGTNSSDYHVDFYAIVGDQTAWPEARSITYDDIGDGIKNTILIAESITVDVIWSQPDDLRFDQMSFTVNDTSKLSISSLHRIGPAVAFADGAVCRLNPKTPETLVRAMITANGGERINRDQLQRDGWLR